jgi:hypothetical protein
MALPNSSDLDGMDYAYQAQPHIQVPTKEAVVLTGMDYAYQAQPFVSNPAAGATYPYTLAVSFVTDHMHLTWSEP